MIPPEGHVDHVRRPLALEGLQVLGRIVRVVLDDVHLLTLAPDIGVRLHLGKPLSSLI